MLFIQQSVIFSPLSRYKTTFKQHLNSKKQKQNKKQKEHTHTQGIWDGKLMHLSFLGWAVSSAWNNEN